MKRQDLRRYAFLITFGRSLSFDSPEEALNNYLESFKEDYEKENGKFSEKDLEFIKDIIEIYMELDQTSKDALKLISKKMIEKQKEREQN